MGDVNRLRHDLRELLRYFIKTNDYEFAIQDVLILCEKFYDTESLQNQLQGAREMYKTLRTHICN